MDPATWMMIASAVLTTAGVVIEQNAQAKAASRRRSAVSTQDENQNPFRDKASEQLQNTSDQFDPNLRRLRREARDAENLKKYSEISDKNKEIREGSVFSDGNITELERYDETGGADREAKRLRDMTNAANFFSPHQASNIDETHLINEMAGNLNTNRNFAQGQFNVDQQIINSIRPDATAMTIGGIFKGLGTAAGFASAGMGSIAAEASKQAAKEAATQAAISNVMAGATSSSYVLPAATSIGPSAITSAAPGIGSGAGSAFSFGLSPAELQKLGAAGTPGVSSTARQMFAPLDAASRGVQDYSYQLWNLPSR